MVDKGREANILEVKCDEILGGVRGRPRSRGIEFPPRSAVVVESRN